MGSALALHVCVARLRILADRFVATDRAWIDLATGDDVNVRVIPAGASASQLEWSARCEVLANLRHPLINPLIDFGAADREHVFEAYAAIGPTHARGAAARTLRAHAVRFLQMHGIELPPPLAGLVLRPVAAGTLRGARPIGVFLQRRGVFEAVADVLDSTAPPGACALAIQGGHGSGLRTLRLATARGARLRGYVPIAAGSLERFPWLREHVRERHVCLIADADARPSGIARLLAHLATESARRHVIVSFARPGWSSGENVLHVDSMGVTAMTAMVFVDREFGPTVDDVFAAARAAGGHPGVCLARLGAHDYSFTGARAIAVHESSQAYEVDPRPVAPRRGGTLQRVIGRAESLAQRGRHAAAGRLLTRATRVLAARGETNTEVEAWFLLGSLARDRARLPEAIAHFERARDRSITPSLSVSAIVGLGMSFIDVGRFIEAEAALRSAIVASEHLNDADLTAAAATALARCLLWRGQPDDAGVALRRVPETSGACIRAYAHALRARADLAEGAIPSAVRSARSAVALAESSGVPRAIAGAYRILGAAVAAAGDRESAATHITQGARAAARAHLPLTLIRLRLTAADLDIPIEAPRMDRLLSHSAEWPPLLQACARAVRARLAGEDMDPATRSFVATTGAVALTRPLAAPPQNPVADLESFLDLAHNAPDERAAVERIIAELHTRLRALTVLVVGGNAERRVIAATGRPWQGDPHIAWRALGGASSVPIETAVEPAQAAEPLRYAGQAIAAVAARWTAGSAVDAARVTSLLRVAALAMAGSVQALIDRTLPAAPSGTWDDLVGDSHPTRELRDAIVRAARAPFPVLIEGESGSGKELVARAIHRLGPRRDRRFCALNCAALSDELIEAELFGHARGAFTGAVGERPGLFEEADGGTLFLDEIGELSARAQAKLLRVLQDGEVRRVGENISRRVDVRIVAATNRRLEEEATAGRFRRDLRFRLDVVRIEVPPLRERTDDVPMLASRFWTDAAARVGTRATLAPDAVAALARYDWPGNVRELQNVIAWMAVHSPRRGRIGPSSLPQHVAQGGTPVTGSFESAKEEFERRFVKAALAASGGQRARAAQVLGVTRQGLAKMMRRLKIE